MSAKSKSSEEVECEHETCQQTFVHLQAMRAHYTQKHEDRLKGRTCELDGCEDPIESREPDARFCTHECSVIAQQNRVSVICDHCDTPFKVKESRANRDQKNFYCTIHCKALAQRTGEYVRCNCCYKQKYVSQCRLKRGCGIHYCSRRCLDIAHRTHFGYGDNFHRHSRPSEFRELIRHAYFHEGHTFEATCRIVTVELEGEFSEEKIEDVVEDLRNHEKNVRHRVWALRPEDLGLAPTGEVGY